MAREKEKGGTFSSKLVKMAHSHASHPCEFQHICLVVSSSKKQNNPVFPCQDTTLHREAVAIESLFKGLFADVFGTRYCGDSGLACLGFKTVWASVSGVSTFPCLLCVHSVMNTPVGLSRLNHDSQEMSSSFLFFSQTVRDIAHMQDMKGDKINNVT